jgi:single-stranded-DNA-specific exonuclease
VLDVSTPPTSHWQLKQASLALAETVSQHLTCPAAIAEILTSRGITIPIAAEAFLNPHINQLHDPTQLLGMATAVPRILHAIHNQEPILIYGDYDVDGTTATVLLKTTIERIATAIDAAKPATVTYHVPHRIREGYGMQNAILADAAANGIRLVISVDTGIRAIAEAAEARALGLDLIVTDHHLADEVGGIPDALAVINPNQPNCPYPNKHLCGAAVAFKLAHALLLAAAPLTPDPGAFTARTNRVLLPSFLKLVAIATIADSVPLIGENRAIAALGLAALANPVQPGLRALMQLAKIPLDRAPTATEVGFRLAPRINAAGRMDIAGDVVELFLTRDPARAIALAEKLDSLNQARRDSEARALEAIDGELQALLTQLGPDATYPADCIILDHPEWHRGVLGILASRVVDRTGRPALILTHADGNAHGSGRSIPGFHLLDALTSANIATSPVAPHLDSETSVEPPQSPVETTPLFHRFGGHAHAVGFSLPSASLPELRARISAYAEPLLTSPLLVPPREYDAELTLAGITSELFAWIARLAPFGIANPEPIFLTRNATLAAPVRLIKERHICLQLTQPEPGVQKKNLPTISALGWSRGASIASNSASNGTESGASNAATKSDPSSWPARCARLGLAQGSAIDILYRLKQSTGPYAGGLELELCDLRLPQI